MSLPNRVMTMPRARTREVERITDHEANRVPFIAALTDEQRALLVARAEVRELWRGAHLWSDQEATGEFCFVLSGRIKLVKRNSDGRETIVDIGMPGQLLCSNAVCAFAPYCCSAVAMEASQALVIERSGLLALLERVPRASRAFLREASARGVTVCSRVEEVASGPVERRVALLLVRLAESVGEARESGQWWIPVRLARQDIADMCGTTVETAIRVMRRLAVAGVVETHSDGFVVADYDALKALTTGPQRRG